MHFCIILIVNLLGLFFSLDVIRWHVHEAKMKLVCGSLGIRSYSLYLLLNFELDFLVEFAALNLLELMLGFFG